MSWILAAVGVALVAVLAFRAGWRKRALRRRARLWRGIAASLGLRADPEHGNHGDWVHWIGEDARVGRFWVQLEDDNDFEAPMLSVRCNPPRERRPPIAFALWPRREALLLDVYPFPGSEPSELAGFRCMSDDRARLADWLGEDVRALLARHPEWHVVYARGWSRVGWRHAAAASETGTFADALALQAHLFFGTRLR